MRGALSPQILALTVAIATTASCTYVLADDYFANNDFFSNFDFSTAPDKNHCFVQYLDQPSASSQGLIRQGPSGAYMGVDSVHQTSSGRASTRIESRKTYTHGLFIADIGHMPGGICGVWPAFWTVGPTWPDDGEIDIIEQVNAATQNLMSLHTGQTCPVNTSSSLGGGGLEDCFFQTNNYQGCGVGDARPGSFGTAFNGNGGGVYAVEWTSQSIVIWFWPRNSIPDNVLSASPDPSSWGVPTAYYHGACNIDSQFRNHRIIIDTAFCGDWAGNAWASSPCASITPSCQDYVANNPGVFSEAYWQIKALRVFSQSLQTS